jgi:hypothetical protein
VHLPNESQPCKTLRFFTLAKDLRWGYSGNLGPALQLPYLLLRVPIPRTALFNVLTLHFRFLAKLKITNHIQWECLQALDPKDIPVLLLAKCFSSGSLSIFTGDFGFGFPHLGDFLM